MEEVKRREMKAEIQEEGMPRRDISAIMRRVRSHDTPPEVAFRKALRARGVRCKRSPSTLPGRPDLVLPSERLVIFIDGDFWHGGQWRRRNLSALEDQFQKSRSKEYWLRKIRRNMARDCAVTAALQSDGWTVLRFWESRINANLNGCIETTLQVIQNAQTPLNISGKLTHRGAAPDPFSLLPQKTFAEFFAGIGLMRIGLERHGWSISFANDIDERKHKMYQTEFEDAARHFLLGDIRTLPIRNIPKTTLATASFPCNDLSLAGRRKGFQGRQSSAFWGFIQALKGMGGDRPPLVLLENVTGFLTSHRGADFEKALLAFNRLGYSVDPFILDAARFTPQSRRRLFVAGVMEVGHKRTAPEKPFELDESDLRPKALVDFIHLHPEIRWNIRPLPSPPQSGKKLNDLLEDLPEDAAEWWSRERTERLLHQMAPRHRAIAEKMIAGEKWSCAPLFRRTRNGRPMAELRTDGLAGCLRTSRGGSARQILFKAGGGESFARLLTPRECARLMGADDYKISASINQALFGFGDAVCVPVIEWIAAYYLNPVVNELMRDRPLGPA